MTQKPVIEVNANFHHIAGANLAKNNDARFAEYRKKWEEYPKKFKVNDFPLFLDIETTSACNLKCPFCATTFLNEKMEKGFITFDMVKKIIDEGVAHGLYGVKFNIRGEPLLHKQIHQFVKYAKQKRLIDVYFNTNAVLLTEDISKKLIDVGLDRLSISFEGFTKDVYEKHRVGANYEKVLSNIEKMQALKAKMKVKHPKIRIQTVMFDGLRENLKEYEEFWSSKVDEVAFLDYKEMKGKKKHLKYPWACPQIWQRMAVWWDGSIMPCNHDDDGLLNLGNIKDVSIREAWHSTKLNNVRKAHKIGSAHEITSCNGCYLRDSEINKLIEKEKS